MKEPSDAIPSGVFEDAASPGMRVLTAIDSWGKLFARYEVRTEMYDPEMYGRMSRDLDAWNRDHRMLRAL